MNTAPIATKASPSRDGEVRLIRREVYFYNLFRVLEGAILCGLMLSPLAGEWAHLLHPGLGRIVAIGYTVFSLFALTIGTRSPNREKEWIDLGVVVDIIAIALAMFSILHQRTSLALLLLVNLGGAALLLPRQRVYAFAALATLGVLLQCFFGNLINQDDRSYVDAVIIGLVYFSVIALCLLLGKRIRDTDVLARRRGDDLLNLAQVNELIIRRMRTGVLVVDSANMLHLWNEAAWAALGNPERRDLQLFTLSPELARRLYRWRNSQKLDPNPVSLSEGAPEVIPRFTRMSTHDSGNVLIFLDDTSMASRRAEQLTLSSLGRLSASIAHEIRNPLAAISYSSQLLAESPTLVADDQRMVEIIRNHTTRVNDIVENILGLARREHSMPEILDLALWARRFVDDYLAGNDLGANKLMLNAHEQTLEVLTDPRQLQQVVWNLVQNAMRYGRQPDQAARVAINVRKSDAGAPLLEVVDRGPGIPVKVAAQIFEPFFTTHELGTGLGLYLARQMCEANQATIEYIPVPAGGSCFRITLASSKTHAPGGRATS